MYLVVKDFYEKEIMINFDRVHLIRPVSHDKSQSRVLMDGTDNWVLLGTPYTELRSKLTAISNKGWI